MSSIAMLAKRPLVPHPDFPCPELNSITVTMSLGPIGLISLEYVADGQIGELQLPFLAESARVSGLWRHTCFEAFVGHLERPGYTELNFSPSREWAAYRFDDYREGMSNAELAPPHFALSMGNDQLVMIVEMQPWSIDNIRIGFAAVIEAKGGRKSYWALAHPPGAPDFHHPACFALELPPPTLP